MRNGGITLLPTNPIKEPYAFQVFQRRMSELFEDRTGDWGHLQMIGDVSDTKPVNLRIIVMVVNTLEKVLYVKDLRSTQSVDFGVHNHLYFFRGGFTFNF